MAAAADFGEALAEIGGVEQKIHFFAFDLPHSDASFVQAYPEETTEAFCAGHTAAFDFFGGVPNSILYDNTRIAVARILGDGGNLKRRTTEIGAFRRCMQTAISIERLAIYGAGTYQRGEDLESFRMVALGQFRFGDSYTSRGAQRQRWLQR